MDLQLFILTVSVLLVTYFLRFFIPELYVIRRSRKAFGKFAAVKPHWFWGHLRIHPGPNEAGLWTNIEWATKCPRLFAFFFLFRPILVLNHPETIKQLLKTAEPKNMIGGGGYKLLMPWIGDGLLLSKGKKWARNRRLLTPGFHFDVLKPYVDVYNKSARLLASTFEMKSQKGRSVEIFNPVTLSTLSIILKCAFSFDENIQTVNEETDDSKPDSTNPYVKMVMETTNLVVERAFKPLFYNNTFYYATKSGKAFKDHCEFSHEKAIEVIHNRRLALKEKGETTPKNRYIDFLDILLLAKDADGKGLSDKEIQDEVETFMFAGHDTTASGISWTLYNLAKHPEFQQKARQEIDELFAERDTKEIQWEDLSKLDYLTMCIKESLRIYPPVHFTGRELTQPLVIDGITVPPQSVVNVSTWNVHHNPTIWGEDHMSYKPHRFLPDNIAKMDSFAFIPFSAGPRNCIGQHFAMNEMKCVVAYILHRFEMTVDETHKLELFPAIILKAKNGIKLHFKKLQRE